MESLMRVLSYFGLTVTAEELKTDGIARLNVLQLIASALDQDLYALKDTWGNDPGICVILERMQAMTEARMLLDQFDVLDEPGPESVTDVPGGLLVGDEDSALDEDAVRTASAMIMMEYGMYNGQTILRGLGGVTPIAYLEIYRTETVVTGDIAYAFLEPFYGEVKTRELVAEFYDG